MKMIKSILINENKCSDSLITNLEKLLQVKNQILKYNKEKDVLEEMIDMFSAESAIKRPNTVEEVAAVALLLAGDAGSGITGTQISVDGGTAQY